MVQKPYQLSVPPLNLVSLLASPTKLTNSMMIPWSSNRYTKNKFVKFSSDIEYYSVQKYNHIFVINNE